MSSFLSFVGCFVVGDCAIFLCFDYDFSSNLYDSLTSYYRLSICLFASLSPPCMMNLSIQALSLLQLVCQHPSTLFVDPWFSLEVIWDCSAFCCRSLLLAVFFNGCFDWVTVMGAILALDSVWSSHLVHFGSGSNSDELFLCFVFRIQIALILIVSLLLISNLFVHLK